MTDPIEVVPYDPEWPELFVVLGRRLRNALGPLAVRIDHIGSTAVPGLSAKPVIDVQVSMASLEPVDVYRHAIEDLGFAWRRENTDLSKRYFRELPGSRRTHIHVRRAGSWSEQFALLFRDYMRLHPSEAVEYAALKYRLAVEYREDRPAYVAGKDSFVWAVMRRATRWSEDTGWEPGSPDF